EAGVGDVAITYENEVLLGQQRGQDYELVVPQSSIIIETPVVVVDSFADKHGTRAAAEGFVSFLFTPAAQQIFADYGFRPVEPSVAKATTSQFAPLADTFKIDQFGDWDKAVADIFGESGVYTLAIAAAQAQ
ncbi:MAG: substrate-binding domain-containing protein, partial [Anaerolineales bacterium]